MSDTHNASTNRASGTATANAERRTRLRLRDLCDEVLASHRIAAGRDPIPQGDRELARALFPIG